MSILYKNKDDVKTYIDIKVNKNIVNIKFNSDCGKHGTDEILDMYNLTPERLLEILQSYDDYEEHEI